MVRYHRIISAMNNALTLKPGRYAEIIPRDGSHYVVVDGIDWSRHDDVAKAEAVRQAIVIQWAAEYDRRAAQYER
jgi:hypothetical protein